MVEEYKDRQKHTAHVLCDPMPVIAGLEELSKTDAILPPNKWRKKTEGGWRTELIFLMENYLEDAVEICVEVDKSMSEE
jgi:hypothetical protein